MQKFILDFNIYSSKDRLEAIRKIPLETLNKSELETVSNYILYGKDQEDGTSVVDRGEIQIKTKYNSYNKEKFISLDEMIESPTFDEAQLSKNQTIYKKVKPTIDKEKAKDIPGMKELWEQIQNLQDIIDENLGKKEKRSSTPILSQKELYQLKHSLIELRTQQYYLWDSEFQTILGQKNKAEFHGSIVDSQMNYLVLPRGVMKEENDWEFKNPRSQSSGRTATAFTEEQLEQLKQSGKYYFDFREKEHIYCLIQNYWDIVDSIKEIPDSPLHGLIWTLDFYIEKAELSKQQLLIIRDKKLRVPNREITKHLKRELGIYHSENYISTIFNKSIGLINEAAILNYDEWLMKDYDKGWKVCTKCGRELLRDSRNFVKKTKSSDGLTNKCKRCDKEERQRFK